MGMSSQKAALHVWQVRDGTCRTKFWEFLLRVGYNAIDTREITSRDRMPDITFSDFRGTP